MSAISIIFTLGIKSEKMLGYFKIQLNITIFNLIHLNCFPNQKH